ncbi:MULTISPECIES: 3'-5' exonuclease [Pseudanabaena]|uniref:3'-5' exonuclease n=1 Tax=Pseudanabaena TaxID=1152 RepID=UPI00247A2961|nr:MULTISPECIES: nuclease-related domain-containing DEAD/DEAH box helicase [Pseudanabaena]MEA5490305.1 3'-5' exonuclease [Pseudanabaena sp. CCNP1317]WGS74066.1 NERD domain-containing protein [Pseudanabaena galeata CCNP1313]
MPSLIPSLNSCIARMTSGEKRFAVRLEQKLDDDYLVWYDVPIGKKQLHPDFIVLHPLRGLLVLEVKDWKIDTIKNVTRANWTIADRHTSEPKQVKNPLEQARNYVLHAVKLLERDADLVHAIASVHAGKCIVPYGYGVVFTNITRAVFDKQGLGEVIESNLVICQDEMYDSVDRGDFQQRLWDMFPYHFDRTLSPHQVNRIRWHIFPDIAIQPSLLPEPKEDEVITPVAIAPDLIKIMDLQQEQLARSLRGGHRVIHGVAGSGKTLILVYRCQFLAEKSDKPILVLCYNISLASRLRQMLREKGIAETKVSVQHFHSWCAEMLRLYQLPLPDRTKHRGGGFFEQLVNQVVLGVNEEKIPKGKYGAVLLDEGHDFQPTWFNLIVQMVDSDTNSLLVLYDDAQSIYERRERGRFSFASVGIKAQGRTTILKLNYRNTEEILSFAYEFAKNIMQPTEDSEEDSPVLIKPQSVGRHGAKPTFTRLSSFSAETKHICDRIGEYRDRGIAWNDMAIIYRSDFMGRSLSRALKDVGIPVEWLNEDSNSKRYHPEAQSVKLLTMHSSKGLEFPVVFIAGVGFMPNQSQAIADEARLLYVAMTRATEFLELSCDRDSVFVKRLERVL